MELLDRGKVGRRGSRGGYVGGSADQYRSSGAASASSACRLTLEVTPYGTRADTIIAVDFTKKIILIGNSSCAGEMKKVGVRHRLGM
jgi:hypothetical protein